MPAKSAPLPNIRQFFIPDTGMMIGDFDLAQADAQVVAWEADDQILKDIFRNKQDLHSMNAEMLRCSRSVAKAACHAMNYGTGAATLARLLGCTVKEAEELRAKWFDIHPAIKEWHRATEHKLMTTRCISNAFGYKRFYFDRIEGLLPEALAWVPQSTVAIIISKAMLEIDKIAAQYGIQLLLQVHDSIVAQFPIEREEECKAIILNKMLVPVPYTDPLIIPSDCKVSGKSWGDVE